MLSLTGYCRGSLDSLMSYLEPVFTPPPTSGWDSVYGSHSERPSRDLGSGRRKINSSLSSPIALSVWFQGWKKRKGRMRERESDYMKKGREKEEKRENWAQCAGKFEKINEPVSPKYTPRHNSSPPFTPLCCHLSPNILAEKQFLFCSQDTRVD